MDLRSLSLELGEQPQNNAVTGEEATAPTSPLRTAETRYDSYTAAIKHLDPPTLFESRPSYRLLDASLADRSLRFGLVAYFDKLDVSEALGHEMALACMDAPGGVPESPKELAGKLPFRDAIGDPFDPEQRAITPAITTLAIRLRRYPQPPTFRLHWRDPAKVTTAAGIYDVVPAGEFQPSSVALRDRRNDFDIWRNVVRSTPRNCSGRPSTTPPGPGRSTRALGSPPGLGASSVGGSGHAAPAGGSRVDALSLAATLLAVVVIDDDVFGETVQYNDEGGVVGLGDGRAADGVPFTVESVNRLLASEPLASSGAACPSLAWQHREHLPGC
ncbi:hypothetical protein GCM10027174_45560 [Salinifilum aidingensis]